MLIALRPNDARPIYLQIMDEIRRGIALELIRPNEPLPSVRQLARDLRVNPNTVQQAYRELERESVVYVRRGRGTFIADVTSSGTERRSLALAVARRALREAFRDGLSPRELLDALETVSEEQGGTAPAGPDGERS